MPQFVSSAVVIGAAAIPGNTGVSYDPGRSVEAPDTDGRGTKTFVGTLMAVPRVELQSLAIKATMAAMASSGADLPYLALSAGQLTWTHRQGAANGPTIAGGSVHEQRTIAASCTGCLAVTGVECAAGGTASLSAVAYLASNNGTTDPVAQAQVAAPADVTTVQPMTLDAATIDATAVSDVISVSLAIAISWTVEHGMKPFPQVVRPRASDWTMTIRHRDPTIGRIKGDKDSSGSFTLIAVGSGPTRGADTVTFTVTGLITNGGDTQSPSGPPEFVTIIRGRYNGTTMPGTWVIA